MPSCVMRKCHNYTGTMKNTPNLSFHLFPTNHFMREEWIRIVRIQRSEHDWTLTTHSTICSKHFQEQDLYSTKKNIRRLKKSAVPFIGDIEEPTFAPIPTSLERVDISDSGSIHVTPGKVFIEKKPDFINQLNPKQQATSSNPIPKNEKAFKKCKTLRTVIHNLKNKKFLSEDQYSEIKSMAKLVELNNRMFILSTMQSYQKKLSLALKKFSVTLYSYSPSAYEYVRQYIDLALPHPRLVGRWYENSSADPGFSRKALNILKSKYERSEKRLICTLVAEVLPLRHQTVWTGKQNVGVVDYGAGSSNSQDMATQAYVFILVCLNENWKIPVAYFLVNGLPAETRASLITTCLSQCYRAGVDIVAVAFDGCAANINAANLLGCNLKNPHCLKTTFSHPECNSEVAVYIDTCHLIKLVRNTLEVKQIIYDEAGKRIRWQHLNNLSKLKKNMTQSFVKKISPRHIHFRNEVMKIELSNQALSMSIVNALILCKELKISSLFSDTEGTASFISFFNNLFDILNSRLLDAGFKKSLSFQNSLVTFCFLERVQKYILGLSVVMKFRRILNNRKSVRVVRKKLVEMENKTGLLGFLICIETVKFLYSALVENERLECISMHRFSLDHIELLFGNTRNLNAIQFKDVFKKLLSHLESNFLDKNVYLKNVFILNCHSAVQNINRTASRRFNNEKSITLIKEYNIVNDDIVFENNVDIFSTLLNRESLTESIQQMVGYISMWISKKLIKSVKCETCIDNLLTIEKLEFHKLISLKDFRGLCLPSEDVFKICLVSEIIVRRNLKENGYTLPDFHILTIRNKILKSFANSSDIFYALHSHSRDQPLLLDHRINLIRAIIENYVSVRLNCMQKKYLCGTKKKKEKRLNLF